MKKLILNLIKERLKDFPHLMACAEDDCSYVLDCVYEFYHDVFDEYYSTQTIMQTFEEYLSVDKMSLSEIVEMEDFEIIDL